MDLSTIKKELYKRNPSAILMMAKKGVLYYWCNGFGPGIEDHLGGIWFHVPFSDMGDAEFKNPMPAKLLIRYIVTPESNTP